MTHDIHLAKIMPTGWCCWEGRMAMEGTFADLEKSEDEFVTPIRERRGC